MIFRTLRTAPLVLLLLLLGVGDMTAQKKPFDSPSFPETFGPNNVGREFYLAFPANLETGPAAEKYVRLYISSPVATNVDIYASGLYKGSITTIPNDIVTFDLSSAEAQLLVYDGNGVPVPDDKIYRGQAVKIIADDPIIVYGMNRTSFTSDGLLALPVNALGRQYVVAAAASNVPRADYDLPSQFMVTAPYDATTVSIKYPYRSPNHAEGETVTITLNEGDVYSVMSTGFKGDMTGAYIQANNPIAVTAGQNCTYLPDENYPACDHITEMLIPVEAWGKAYHAVPFQNRTRGDTYRIFAGEPNANVYVNGVLFATIPSVGGQVSSGWVTYREEAVRALDFTSDKRIFVAQYNNSQTYDGGSASDPFYTILSPIEQFQTEFIFTTPGNSFPTYFVNIVGDSLTIENAEITKVAPENWQRAVTLPSAKQYTFPTIIDGKKYLGLNFPISDGVYRIRSTGPMGGYIYAGGAFDSFGYPLAVVTTDQSKPDEDPPTITGEPDCSGFVSGSVKDWPNDVAIRTNLNSVELALESFNYKLERDRIRAGVDRTISYTLTVVNPNQDAMAILVAIDNAGNTSYDTVHYAARNVAITPNPLVFSDSYLNERKTLDVTVRNNGGRSIDIKELLLQKGTEGFDIVTPEGAFSLDPGEEIKATISFEKGTEGQFSDSLGFSDSCGTFWVILLRGKTVAPIIKVSDWDFGQQPIGQPAFHDLTIENTGTGILIVDGFVGTALPTAEFSLPNGDPAFPLNISAGGSQLVKVRFIPTAEAAYSDQMEFSHNAPPHPDNDPIGFVEGEGILATIVGTPKIWDPKRVLTGPYRGQVVIRNEGTDAATIKGVLAWKGDQADFAILNPEDFSNATLNARDSIIVDVSFTPQVVGNRSARIYYNVNNDLQDSTAFSDLSGIGLVPSLITHDLTFDPMNIGSPEVMKTVTFELNPTVTFRDTVWIEDFEFVSDNNGAGKDDFRYDPVPGGFPIVLIPNVNESVTINAYFSATRGGARNASLKAITRDGVDTTSFWDGVGVAQDAGVNIRATAASSLCLGEIDSIDVTIESVGDVPLTITEITIDDPNNEFEFDVDPAVPMQIPPGETRTLKVYFTPVLTGVRTATLSVKSNDPVNPTADIELSGEAQEFVIPGQLLLTGTDPKSGLAVMGQEMTATVRVDAPLDPLMANGYRVVFTYNPKQLIEPNDVNDIKLNQLLHPAGSTVMIDPASTPGRLILDVTTPSPLVGQGELFGVPFGVVFDTALTREIQVEFEFAGAECTSIDIESTSHGVTPLCGLNLRLIELVPGAKFALTGATPNPINSDLGEVEYSLGLDGDTRVEIYDATGNFVAALVDQYQEPGVYRVQFDASRLPSGVYYCVLKSGHYVESKPMTVAQ